MSNPPPPEPLPPFDPTRPFDPPQPYAHQTGDTQSYPPPGQPHGDQNDPAGYPPTAQFPPYQPPPPVAARRSNVPLVAVILAVTLLLCGGTAFAGVLVYDNLVGKAEEVLKPITELPTDLPTVPTELPTLPTDIPNLPGLPTDSDGDPYLPNGTTKVTVVYEVAGDGPADITYIEKLGKSPKRVKNVKLPWRKEITLTGATLVSVIAFRTDSTPGSIRCTTTVDGDQVAKRDADGSFAVATCSKLIL